MPLADQLTSAFVAYAGVVSREGQTAFHLRLEPPQLGSVQIHLTATDHTISARVIVAQAGTQQILQGQAHQLRQSLAESGLVLGSFDVMYNGGGSSQGGRHQSPEPPESPAPPINSRSESTPAVPAGVEKTPRIVSTRAIDLLA